MREIKFRAWDKVAKEMRLVQSVVYADDGFAGTTAVKLVGGALHLYVHGESCELMQYTGLKDKNGTEIYEGDLIRSYNEFGEAFEILSVVTWSQEELRFNGVNTYEIELEEVAGNIHQNPELLEAKG